MSERMTEENEPLKTGVDMIKSALPWMVISTITHGLRVLHLSSSLRPVLFAF
jgi:hypothetical protein